MALKIEKHKGVYGDGLVYTMESIEDFDMYEEVLRQRDTDFFTGFKSRNFNDFKSDFEKHQNGTIVDKGKKYKILGMQDDDANADWYWVGQNVDDEREIEYFLVNDSTLEIID